MVDLIQQIDDAILIYILEHFHTPLLDRCMIFITSLGNSNFIWILITFLMLRNKKTRACGVLLTCSLLLEHFVCDGILKNFYKRERPFTVFPHMEILIKKPRSFSFPSGHTMSSFTAASVLFYFDKRFGIPALILAGFISFSRLYLFCHYPTDVLCGMILGVYNAAFVIFLYRLNQSKITDGATRR